MIAPALGATVAPAAALSRERVPAAVFLLLVCVVLIPIEISLYVGPLFLTAAKIYLILITFVMIPRLLKFQPRGYDWTAIAHGFWTAAAFLLIYGPDPGIQRSGFYLLEFLIVYLVARLYLTTIGQILATVKLLFWMVAINAAFALPEALTGRKIVHEFARSLTGFYYPYGSEVRMGLYRSTAFFEHSILLGVFCASTLALVWYTSTAAQRGWRVPVIFAGTLFAASSAPIMVFLLQSLLIGMERVTRGVKNRLTIFFSTMAVLVIFLESASNRGFVGVLSSVVMNPQTTYMRMYQWQYAIDDVMANPLFGIDPPTYSRPNWMSTSIDNYWLLIMLRSGIPALLLLFGTILLVWLALSRRRDAPALLVALRNGWGMMMLALLLTGATVAFFGKLQPLLSFFIALGAALASVSLPAGGAVAEVKDDPRAPSRYTRFAGPAGVRPPRPSPDPAPAASRAALPGPLPAPLPVRPAAHGLRRVPQGPLPEAAEDRPAASGP